MNGKNDTSEEQDGEQPDRFEVSSIEMYYNSNRLRCNVVFSGEFDEPGLTASGMADSVQAEVPVSGEVEYWAPDEEATLDDDEFMLDMTINHMDNEDATMSMFMWLATCAATIDSDRALASASAIVNHVEGGGGFEGTPGRGLQ